MGYIGIKAVDCSAAALYEKVSVVHTNTAGVALQTPWSDIMQLFYHAEILNKSLKYSSLVDWQYRLIFKAEISKQSEVQTQHHDSPE